MKKIDIAELLKDCPKGTELYSPIFGELKFNEVNAINNRILVVQQNDYIAEFESDGRLINCKNGECLLFPSKDQRDWSKFEPPCEFKDGDIVATTNGLFVGILEVKNNKPVGAYCSIDYVKDFRINNDYVFDRLATEEEKQKLFDAIKANGYKWNAETKTLVKLPKFKVGDRVKKNKDYISGIVTDIFDDSFKVTYDGGGCSYVQFYYQDDWELVPDKFAITTLKPFDKVLVRDNNEQFWTCDWFSFHDTRQVYPFACVGHYVSQCIPYEKNEHLLGTTDDCDEYYKTW